MSPDKINQVNELEKIFGDFITIVDKTIDKVTNDTYEHPNDQTDDTKSSNKYGMTSNTPNHPDPRKQKVKNKSQQEPRL